ncbi:helix-turn-helix transcriptional regulator [Tsukamurella tyrosinosolvens]|uniref:helix-turn-helix transcriptional regulator n=1 Tax=Tsukamurella tyrosinosolvens TaxID=57704 RepID=UPI000C7F7035|nr:DNA-binding protein [Tsukamurella tyrosinosolvens]AUN40929.1 hypothetical protein ASU32_13690 [Tsukamurella tyrosinosolvens]
MNPTFAPAAGLATPAEVAEYRRVTVAALAQERYLGRGPAYIKTGRTIRYRWEDVHAFLASARIEPQGAA